MSSKRKSAPVRDGAMRHRNVCFTDYAVDTFQERFEALKSCASVRYVVAGLERCSTTGRPHYQGYCEFNSQLTRKQVKEILGNPAVHIEERQDQWTNRRAIAYCKKGNQSHEEWGLDGVNGANYGLEASVLEHGEPKRGGVNRNLFWGPDFEGYVPSEPSYPWERMLFDHNGEICCYQCLVELINKQ